MYKKIKANQISTQGYLMLLSVGGDEDKRNEAQKEWLRNMIDWIKYYENNKIFFSVKFCDLMNEFRNKNTALNNIITYELRDKNLYVLMRTDNEEHSKYLKTIQSAQESLQKDIKPIISQLEIEFRILLGVEN